MTCGCLRYMDREQALGGAAVSHSAELVRAEWWGQTLQL